MWCKSMLYNFFYPDSIAIIGLTIEKTDRGYVLLENLLLSNYKGKIFPINSEFDEIKGIKTFNDIKEVNEKIDLVILFISPYDLYKEMDKCGKLGISNILICGPDFNEIGVEEKEEENKIKTIIKKYNLNVIGPNSLGIMNTHFSLNASFRKSFAPKGNIALISQSAFIIMTALDWVKNKNVGFSKIISLGNRIGLSDFDLFEYLINDDETDVIICYYESISDGVNFVNNMKKFTFQKPIIILKSGVSDSGAKLASTHSGSLAISDNIIDTAFNQSGIIRVYSIQDLFNFAYTFSKIQSISGNRIAIVTNTGCGGIILADNIENSSLELSNFNNDNFVKLNQLGYKNLNPLDVCGNAEVNIYDEVFGIVSQDNAVDILVLMLVVNYDVDYKGIINLFNNLSQKFNKPIILMDMYGPITSYLLNNYKDSKILSFNHPENFIKVMESLYNYSNFKKRSLINSYYQINNYNRKKINEILENVKKENRDFLFSYEAYEVLNEYGILVNPTFLINSIEEAEEYADKIGFPVVLKIVSDKISHKSDIGGVKININSKNELINSYNEIINNINNAFPNIEYQGIEISKMQKSGVEILIGMFRNEQFGPIIVFGYGGIYTNLFEDVSFLLVNGLTEEYIDKQIKNTKVYELIKGYRGENPKDFEAIKDIIKKIAKLSIDFPEISELDINPIFVYEKSYIAVDIKIKL